MDQHSPIPPATSRPPRTRRTRLIGGTIAVLSMAALGYLAWTLTNPAPGGAGGPGGPGMSAGGPGGGGGGGRGPGGGRGGPATTVGVATATVADIPVTLEALGTVMPAAIVTVRPQVSGVLQKIHFTEGQLVKPGQVLATIDPRPFRDGAAAGERPAPARRSAARQRARHAQALPHAARTGFDRAPGSRHPGRAGQAARRHGDDRPRRRRHRPAQPRATPR